MRESSCKNPDENLTLCPDCLDSSFADCTLGDAKYTKVSSGGCASYGIWMVDGCPSSICIAGKLTEAGSYNSK